MADGGATLFPFSREPRILVVNASAVEVLNIPMYDVNIGHANTSTNQEADIIQSELTYAQELPE